MSKRPSFQFYPPDWRNDPRVRLCSVAARGLWIDMLCLMHEGEPYGHLTAGGRPMTIDGLARLVGEGQATVKRLLAELESNGVYSLTDGGVIYSRRMVRDEEVREARAAGGQDGAAHGYKGAAHGRKGGRPKKDNGGSDDETRGDKKPPLEPSPSSSSSSPSSEGSETKVSADVADPDVLTWRMVKLLLPERCGMSEDTAGRFFGKLLADHGLRARDLLPAVSSATINQTGDPKSYLAKAAAGLGKSRAEPRLSPSQLAARSNIQ